MFSVMLLAEVAVLLVLAGLPLCRCSGSRGECLSECFQRRDDLGECPETELVHDKLSSEHKQAASPTHLSQYPFCRLTRRFSSYIPSSYTYTGELLPNTAASNL